ncbi:GlxA family transcriptional regulator [Mycolicibacterium litorale]|uniref:AraC family transcriptional regulator n=1 Tax=Mycolicibacterium litorale TaxID=758802 RepID=A0AAD1IPB1_9MYCO|nr:helix-turn-helix domain-containing protein [Mycolicibacterium litorale]MCV7417005.1 DJ-1/PfpI family protein [Mycolicibacterium litorale]TDY04791.1 AraC family transcriptional regulator with amidase-like domain [Mycolicibacterium litorale]BBY18218.1 AraC family transcriptional regulator [Mycolicibacterium litorale]
MTERVTAPAHHVVVLLYDGIQMLDATGPVDAFAAANTAGAHYRITHASISGRDVTASSGARLGVEAAADDVSAPIDTLLVPGTPEWQAGISDRVLVETVRALAERSTRTVAICAGAFPLAATGLLDGRRAATHWRLARHLAARFPDVTVDPAAIFVTDGPYTTTAGVTAGIDLTLSLIERDHGPALAREVARELVVFMARPGDQSQFSVRTEAIPTTNTVVRTAMNTVTADPGADHSLDKLAAAAGVSARHLSRLFRDETGYTPQRFVDRVRLEAACNLLTSGPHSLDHIAEHTGVGSSTSLRRLFHRELGITPGTYRQRFRTTHR